jgi:hypothetical protein
LNDIKAFSQSSQRNRDKTRTVRGMRQTHLCIDSGIYSDIYERLHFRFVLARPLLAAREKPDSIGIFAERIAGHEKSSCSSPLKIRTQIVSATMVALSRFASEQISLSSASAQRSMPGSRIKPRAMRASPEPLQQEPVFMRISKSEVSMKS